MRHVKLVLIAVVAALVAAFAVGTASANTITAEPSGGIAATSLGNLRLTGRGGLINITTECPVTLNGSINRTINNAARGAVGSVTEGRVGRCSTGEARALVESRSAWELELAEATRLEGTPKLAKINTLRAAFQITVAGVSCLYRGTVPTSLEGEGEPVVTRLLRVLANSVSRSSGSALCPPEGELSGSFSITTQTLRLR